MNAYLRKASNESEEKAKDVRGFIRSCSRRVITKKPIGGIASDVNLAPLKKSMHPGMERESSYSGEFNSGGDELAGLKISVINTQYGDDLSACLSTGDFSSLLEDVSECSSVTGLHPHLAKKMDLAKKMANQKSEQQVQSMPPVSPQLGGGGAHHTSLFRPMMPQECLEKRWSELPAVGLFRPPPSAVPPSGPRTRSRRVGADTGEGRVSVKSGGSGASSSRPSANENSASPSESASASVRAAALRYWGLPQSRPLFEEAKQRGEDGSATHANTDAMSQVSNDTGFTSRTPNVDPESGGGDDEAFATTPSFEANVGTVKMDVPTFHSDDNPSTWNSSNSLRKMYPWAKRSESLELDDCSFEKNNMMSLGVQQFNSVNTPKLSSTRSSTSKRGTRISNASVGWSAISECFGDSELTVDFVIPNDNSSSDSSRTSKEKEGGFTNGREENGRDGEKEEEIKFSPRLGITAEELSISNGSRLSVLSGTSLYGNSRLSVLSDTSLYSDLSEEAVTHKMSHMEAIRKIREEALDRSLSKSDSSRPGSAQESSARDTQRDPSSRWASGAYSSTLTASLTFLEADMPEDRSLTKPVSSRPGFAQENSARDTLRDPSSRWASGAYSSDLSASMTFLETNTAAKQEDTGQTYYAL